MVDITLPDGSVRTYDKPVTVGEIAASIGPGLAKAALGGRVDGKLVDVSHRIGTDANVAIVTDRDAEGLDLIRHSSAHLLAYAVKELFPDAQVTIGPVIENGFYYDFAYSRPFTPEDLAAIEQRMALLAKKDFPVSREVWPRDRAVAFFKSLGEHYKAELIGAIPPGEEVSLYREGDFVDLCRGPHVPSSGRLKVFKLMKVAGAYWRGDPKNEQLQRIYGTAWARKDELDAYLHMLEEAEKRDHRKLGRQLDLFHLQDEAPGMVFWHPHGWTVWQQIEQYLRGVLGRHGYREVKTPQVMDRALWEKSGHWENYKEFMFTTASENRDYAVKPMNCPGHIQIFNQGIKSYRELPLRLAEFGSCHRNEPALALALEAKALGYALQPGEGAFYGPKIEFSLKDCLGRVWQCGTLQLDFSLPGRLGAEYVGEDNARHTPVMLHRAILGSLERFIGILIEHHAGAFPLWLAPVQVVVMNISEPQADYAAAVADRLRHAGLRVECDLRNEKIGYKIREHSMLKRPYYVVIGDKEKAVGLVAVRARGNQDLGQMSPESLIERLLRELSARGAVA